ncbi:fibronectin type III domain-containing protein [Delftia lacustris]|uniref:fibronectin type III domain-containing protein n=1 Tax=Delftia lacustris TaxID=558537 RepID=UPI001EF157CB|nr:fibronectin type III domain-containing protein [Delftia lacustris]
MTAAWDAVPGAAYYVVELSQDSFASVASTAVALGNSQALEGLQPGSYTLRVRAVNGLGGSTAAVSVPFMASAPPTASLPELTAFSGVVGDANDPLASAGIGFTVQDAGALAAYRSLRVRATRPWWPTPAWPRPTRPATPCSGSRPRAWAMPTSPSR